MKQKDYQVQQRNGPVIHDVISAKYNEENEIFSHKLTCFSRLNRKTEKNHTQKFYCKMKTLF